jgi:hypothetical protein
MRKIYRALFVGSWLLGVLSLLAALVLRFSPAMGARFDISTRGGIFIAIALFLSALASREMERADSA